MCYFFGYKYFMYDITTAIYLFTLFGNPQVYKFSKNFKDKAQSHGDSILVTK